MVCRSHRARIRRGPGTARDRNLRPDTVTCSSQPTETSSTRDHGIRLPRHGFTTVTASSSMIRAGYHPTANSAAATANIHAARRPGQPARTVPRNGAYCSVSTQFGRWGSTVKLSGPFVTLFAGASLAGTLLIAGQAASSGASPAATAQAAQAAQDAQSAAGSGAAAPATSGTPGNAAAVQRGSYVGNVPGAGRLALVVRDGVAIAYLCDGRNVEAWLQGPARSGTLQLTGRKGASLVGRYDRDHATGTVVIGGVGRPYDIAWVAKPSGLYRATARLRGAEVRAGWIVLPDGSQVGLLSDATGGGTRQAPPLDVSSTRATVDGTTLVAVPVDGDGGTGF